MANNPCIFGISTCPTELGQVDLDTPGWVKPTIKSQQTWQDKARLFTSPSRAKKS
jgi:hypothetical protein